MPDQHIVYAVIDQPAPERGKIICRISEPQPYGVALAIFDLIDQFVWPASFAMTASHMLIDYLAVRSVDDPNWPSDAPLSTVRDAHGQPYFNNMHTCDSALFDGVLDKAEASR